MTDKQIMINGVDVSKCENFRPKDRFTCYPYICNCHQKSNCYFKQLARKTQECEELKNNNKILGDLYESVDTALQERTKKYDCYRKALEEIEEICLEDTRTFADGTQVRYDSLDKIIDIINKAKGER